METFIVLSIVFGSIVAIILGPRYLRLRHELNLKALDYERSDETRKLKALTAENHDLEARVHHLESIVCSLDFELNAKLNRISTRQLELAPAAHAALAATVDGVLVNGDGGNGGQRALPARLTQESRALYTGEVEPGMRVADRYVIETSLGAGGMGAVYRARDEKLGERVALKVVRDAHLATPAMLERFRREVTTARRVHHANVVRIHDLGESDGVMFISMEYVEGETLRAVLERQGKLPLERVRAVVSQVLSALQAAHDAGVVHRDLKPDNVLVDSEQRIKLIDFGIARLDQLEGLTATHSILGTPEYMAPEQIRGERVDARTDLYALGIMVFEMLVGRTPFAGTSPIAVSFAHCTEEPPAISTLVPSLDDAWIAIVERALSKKPDDRWLSAQEMKAALP